MLYGSYARGTNTSESDVDIALLLKGNLNESTEDKLSDLLETAYLLMQSGKFKASVNRSYYAIFHGLRAVTALAGFDSSKHSGGKAEKVLKIIKPYLEECWNK